MPFFSFFAAIFLPHFSRPRSDSRRPARATVNHFSIDVCDCFQQVFFVFTGPELFDKLVAVLKGNKSEGTLKDNQVLTVRGRSIKSEAIFILQKSNTDLAPNENNSGNVYKCPIPIRIK